MNEMNEMTAAHGNSPPSEMDDGLREQVAEDRQEFRLTPVQSTFVEADMLYENMVKPFLENYRIAKAAVVAEIGYGEFFKDADGTVYKTEQCKGKFVYFETVEIKRTRRNGEEKGSLSMKEAREAGYEVEGK